MRVLTVSSIPRLSVLGHTLLITETGRLHTGGSPVDSPMSPIKNGVGVSGVASVPWGGISSEWSSGFSTLVGIEAEKVAKFLHYHGVDGLGYNSEFSTGSSFILSGLRALHETVHKYLTEKR